MYKWLLIGAAVIWWMSDKDSQAQTQDSGIYGVCSNDNGMWNQLDNGNIGNSPELERNP